MNTTAPLVLVTGATDGIGLATTLGLARLGARVVIHGRNPERIAATETLLRKQGLQAAGSVRGDFADLSSVRAMAKQVGEDFPGLDVLLNNAGVFMQRREVSVDGHELTWQVNHLAPVLLTMELLPLLRGNAPARIINVASIAHARGSINLADPGGEGGYDGYAAYAQSKLANVLFTYELAERLVGSDVDVNCLHPGVIGTKLLQEGFGIDGASLDEGARTSIHLAVSEDLSGVSGKYFVREMPTPSSKTSYDVHLGKDLWELTMHSLGLSSDI